MILQRYFTYFYLAGHADFMNFRKFYYPPITRLKTGFLYAAGDAPGKTSLKTVIKSEVFSAADLLFVFLWPFTFHYSDISAGHACRHIKYKSRHRLSSDGFTIS